MSPKYDAGYLYDSLDQIVDEILLRVDIVKSALHLGKQQFAFPSTKAERDEKGFIDRYSVKFPEARYWLPYRFTNEKEKTYAWGLRPTKATLLDAVEEFFTTTNTGIAFECQTPITLIMLRNIGKRFPKLVADAPDVVLVSGDLFDKASLDAFQEKKPGVVSKPFEKWLSGVSRGTLQTNYSANAIPGDTVIFRGRGKKLTDPDWRIENTIYIGKWYKTQATVKSNKGYYFAQGALSKKTKGYIQDEDTFVSLYTSKSGADMVEATIVNLNLKYFWGK